jgi:hypothetical protein
MKERLDKCWGWKRNIKLAAWGAAIVTLLNICFTAWVMAHKTATPFWEGGIYVLSAGSCSTIAAKFWWIDLVINGLSSLLVVASNSKSFLTCKEMSKEAVLT